MTADGDAHIVSWKAKMHKSIHQSDIVSCVFNRFWVVLYIQEKQRVAQCISGVNFKHVVEH